MSFKVQVERYTRSPDPQLPESQIKQLQQELRKLERVLDTMYNALKELDQRTS